MLEQKQVLKEKPKVEEASSGEIQLVVFKLGKEDYGVEIHEVREIVKMTDITTIPNSPDFVEGITNLRGKIVVVINLLKRFGTFNQDEHRGTHIIISEVENNSFGIMVDDVEEVLKVPKKDIRKAPGIISAKIHSEYLKGIGILDEGKRLLILIDLNKILSEKEMMEMAKITESIKTKAREEMEKKKLEEGKKRPRITDKEIEEKFKESFTKKEPLLEKDVHEKREEDIPDKEELEEVLGKNPLEKRSRKEKEKLKEKEEMRVIGKEDNVEENKLVKEVKKKFEKKEQI